ncbi:hypothetical protein [Salinimicrobium gaetbulicola]|uniref:Uncharacterized protein n=1 Tax=Salinimicrobium gaetbulicola TaxID=999702 RepID=A0ABW3IBJ9_9FLAO
MVEIKIEKKKPIWPWIILVLVILAILYFLVFADDDAADDMEEMDDMEQIDEESVWDDADTTSWEEETDTTGWDTTGDTIGAAGAGVTGYLTHIADSTKMGVDHQYTNMALLKLMDAVQAKADEINFDISADMAAVKQDASAIKENPTAATHVKKIKDAGTKLANILQKMQQQKFPALNQDIQEMKTAASNIDVSVKTLQQKEQIKKFFNEAADVLKKMS